MAANLQGRSGAPALRERGVRLPRALREPATIGICAPSGKVTTRRWGRGSHTWGSSATA